MKRIVRFSLVLAFLGESLSAAFAATLIVRVEAVSPKGGTLRVALYDRSSYDGHDSDPVADKVVNAIAPETTVEFANLPAGTYAIKMFQDINRNGAFDMDFGLPAEPFGFSNNAHPLFDQPSFDSTKFTVKDGRQMISIRLQHWLSETWSVARAS